MQNDIITITSLSLGLTSCAWSLYLLSCNRADKTRMLKLIQCIKDECASAKLKANINFELNKQDSSTDSAVRILALPVLGAPRVVGDSFGLPTLEDITQALINRGDAAQAALKLAGSVTKVERIKSHPLADKHYVRVITQRGAIRLTEEAWAEGLRREAAENEAAGLAPDDQVPSEKYKL